MGQSKSSPWSSGARFDMEMSKKYDTHDYPKCDVKKLIASSQIVKGGVRNKILGSFIVCGVTKLSFCEMLKHADLIYLYIDCFT